MFWSSLSFTFLQQELVRYAVFSRNRFPRKGCLTVLGTTGFLLWINDFSHHAYDTWDYSFLTFKTIFYWCIVDLQCCVSFRCTAKWYRYIYRYISIYIIFQIPFPYRSLQNIEYSSRITLCLHRSVTYL